MVMGVWPMGAMPRRGGRGTNHVLLSGAAVLAALIAALVSVQFYGDPADVGPRVVVRLDAAQAAHGGDAPHTTLGEVLVPSEGQQIALEERAWPQEQPPLPIAAKLPGSVPASAIPAQAANAPASPQPSRAAPLAKAPLAGLTAPGPKGQLPIIRKDGLTPFQAYRRPYVREGAQPRIALVVSGLGFNAEITKRAIEELPAQVTLSFVPYAGNLQRWIDLARAKGHEVLLEIPMEPFDVGAVDTGPQTLLAQGPAAENIARLEDLLSRAVGYAGITNYQGGRFANSAEAGGVLADQLKARGLGFIAGGLSGRSPAAEQARARKLAFAASDRVLDVRRDADSIAAQLLALETQARDGGEALGAGFAFPVTIAQIASWSADLQARGFELAPASAVAEARMAK